MKELKMFRKYLNEGVVNEGVNLDDKLNTLKDLDSWMDSEELEDTFDDLVLGLNAKFGDQLVDSFFRGSNWDYKDDSEREKYLNGDKGTTKREMVAVILDFHINDMLVMFDTEEEDERHIKFRSLLRDKAREKLNITIN